MTICVIMLYAIHSTGSNNVATVTSGYYGCSNSYLLVVTKSTTAVLKYCYVMLLLLQVLPSLLPLSSTVGGNTSIFCMNAGLASTLSDPAYNLRFTIPDRCSTLVLDPILFFTSSSNLTLAFGSNLNSFLRVLINRSLRSA
mmetsp:Transcript_32215/g.69809  ORF Transcript_32215/g.69809 Transcript_32215/m.69809 type:complete len:141 (+) Transcript_32215:1045-1467(+)